MAKKKILVVDDEIELIELVKYRLESAGHQVVTANSGLEGISKASSELPDLIILDIAMPEMDGYTTVQKLRENETLRETPVIMLTTYAQMQDLFQAEGVCDYIVKPFEAKDFLLRVEKVLKKEK